MAAAELTIAELQQLVQATIVQRKAVSEAGAKTAERLDGLQESLDKYASSSAKAFDALATTTTSSLARTESTLGRVLVAHNSLDAEACGQDLTPRRQFGAADRHDNSSRPADRAATNRATKL